MACRFASFLLLALLTALAARAAELVVVDARGVNLRPGSVVDSANPLVLKDGQRVTLIAANGSTLKLQGPFDGPIEAGGAGEVNRVAAALKLLVVQKDARLSEIGTVRAALRG